MNLFKSDQEDVEMQDEATANAGPADSIMEKLQKLHSDVVIVPPSTEDAGPTIRPGWLYPTYQIGAEIPVATEMLLRAVSKLTVISRDDIEVAVRKMEVLCRNNEWVKEKKRRSVEARTAKRLAIKAGKQAQKE